MSASDGHDYVAANALSSSPSCRSGDALVLYVFCSVFVGHVMSEWWEKVVAPLIFYRAEARLQGALAELDREIRLNDTVDTMHLGARAQRRAATVRAELRACRDMRDHYTVSLSFLRRWLLHCACRALGLAYVSCVSSSASPRSSCDGALASSSNVGQSSSQTVSAVTEESAAKASAAPCKLWHDLAGKKIMSLIMSSLCRHEVAQSLWNGVWYNLPALLMYALRYVCIVVLLYCYGNAQVIIHLPFPIFFVFMSNTFSSWTATRQGHTARAMTPENMLSTGASIHSSTTTSALCHTGERDAVVQCSVMCWMVACIVALKFVTRVFC